MVFHLFKVYLFQLLILGHFMLEYRGLPKYALFAVNWEEEAIVPIGTEVYPARCWAMKSRGE